MINKVYRNFPCITCFIILFFYLVGCTKKAQIVNDPFGELMLDLFITHHDLSPSKGSVFVNQTTWTDSTNLISISFHENVFLRAKYKGFGVLMNKEFNHKYFKAISLDKNERLGKNKDEENDLAPPSEYLNVQLEVCDTSNCIMKILLVSSNESENKEKIYFLKQLNTLGLMCNKK